MTDPAPPWNPIRARRLCQLLEPKHLSALADALQASAKGALKRGPREKEIDAGVIVTIKQMLHAGNKPGEVARAIASQVPGVSPESQLKRARREVKQWVGHRSGTKVSYEHALTLWAGYEAKRQLEQEIADGALSEADAVEQMPGRISEIKSRATHG